MRLIVFIVLNIFVHLFSFSQNCYINVNTSDCSNCYLAYSNIDMINPLLNPVLVFQEKDSLLYNTYLKEVLPPLHNEYSVILNDSIYNSNKAINKTNIVIIDSNGKKYTYDLGLLSLYIEDVNNHAVSNASVIEIFNKDLVFSQNSKVIYNENGSVVFDRKFNKLYYVDFDNQTIIESKINDFAKDDMLRIYRTCFDSTIYNNKTFSNTIDQLWKSNYSIVKYKSICILDSTYYLFVSLSYPSKGDNDTVQIAENNKLFIVRQDTISEILDVPEYISNNEYYVMGNDFYVNNDTYYINIKRADRDFSNNSSNKFYASFKRIGDSLRPEQILDFNLPKTYIENKLYYQGLQPRICYPYITTILSPEIYNIENDSTLTYNYENHVSIDYNTGQAKFDYILHDLILDNDSIFLIESTEDSYKLKVLNSRGQYLTSFIIDLKKYKKKINSFVTFVNRHEILFIASNRKLIKLRF